MLKAVASFLLCLILSIPARADLRRFQSADGTRDFTGELVGYDPKTEMVSVKMQGRVASFKLSLLSEDDQEYVKEQGEVLALVNQIEITLTEYRGKPTKKEEDRIVDRIYPSGYEVRLSNRSRQTFENLEFTYTVYYGEQDYLKEERKTRELEGKMKCSLLAPLRTDTLQTEPVPIVSGKLEPVIVHERRRMPDGTEFVETRVAEPGGRRKDQLIGCEVRLLLDGKVVKRVSAGDLTFARKKVEQMEEDK
ncbi:MAG: hypothetical protein MUF31_08515 [Akkermansiaceae bacterium]|nr:hypothetical protein [Akkermansiaceae bacterium]